MILNVVNDAAPLVRDADEFHDTLLIQRLLPAHECLEWQDFLTELIAAGRASTEAGQVFWRKILSTGNLARALDPCPTPITAGGLFHILEDPVTVPGCSRTHYMGRKY